MVTFNPSKSQKANKKVSKWYSDDHSVVILDPDSNPEYICNCGFRLSILDKSENSYRCKHCKDIVYPSELTKKRSRIPVSAEYNDEPVVSSISSPSLDDVAIKKEPELQGSFAEMAKRDIRFTSYDERAGDGSPL
jgi:hypothetical protein